MRIGMGFVGCAILAAAMMITAAFAQPFWGDGWVTIANPLGLTTEQMNQIQEVVVQWRKELTPVWSKLQAKNLELQRLMWDAKADPAEVEARTREIGDLQARMQRKWLERRAAIREILTEEQRSQYDVEGMGYGFGCGPCGLNLRPGWGRGLGRRRGPGRGGGAFGTWDPGWGRGPCGMGLGRGGWRIPTQ
jgi:Spy/CpxP family protein refolding chaperone